MLKLGMQNVSALHLGGQAIKKAYLGDGVVFSRAVDPDVCNITASIDPAGSGTVTGTGQYQKGTQVTIEAVPADGYKFTGWQENGDIVSTDASYTFAVTSDRELTAVFAVAHVSRLPDGYTEVEYIQSSGTQYIDTGILPTDIGKIQMGVHEVTGNYPYFFGNTTAFYDNSPTYKAKYGFFMLINMGSGEVRACAHQGSRTSGTPSVSSTTVANNVTETYLEVELNSVGGTASVNGVSASISVYSSPRSKYNVFLLCLNDYNLGTQTKTNFMSAKMSYCKVYDNSLNLSRDFVPCISPSDVVGLYDLVEGKFYGNAGTGAFTAGPAV